MLVLVAKVTASPTSEVLKHNYRVSSSISYIGHTQTVKFGLCIKKKTLYFWISKILTFWQEELLSTSQRLAS
jgi:hypothetical protein